MYILKPQIQKRLTKKPYCNAIIKHLGITYPTLARQSKIPDSPLFTKLNNLVFLAKLFKVESCWDIVEKKEPQQI